MFSSSGDRSRSTSYVGDTQIKARHLPYPTLATFLPILRKIYLSDQIGIQYRGELVEEIFWLLDLEANNLVGCGA